MLMIEREREGYVERMREKGEKVNDNHEKKKRAGNLLKKKLFTDLVN